MQLRKKEITAPSTESGAATLPGLMAGIEAAQSLDSRMLELIPLERLQPAPAEWNFYAPLPDGKFIELIDSIQSSGLLHPIVVWKQPGQDKFTVLSGHNRLRAYTALYEKTGDKEYAKIAATVLSDITQSEAREIVIDSNWVQRNLTTSEKAKSIYQKYVLAGRKKRSANGVRRSNYDIIAEDYQLSSRQIIRYIKLATISEPLLKLVDEEKLPIATAIKLVDFPEETQKYLAEHWSDKLRSKQMGKLIPTMSTAMIDEVLSYETVKVNVSFSVPIELEKELKDLVLAWLNEKENISSD